MALYSTSYELETSYIHVINEKPFITICDNLKQLKNISLKIF